MENNNRWIISSQNLPEAVYPPPLRVNNHQFIVVPQRHPQDEKYKNSVGIHKYNAITNKWTKIMNYPTDFNSINHRSTIDIKNNMIYIFNEDSQLLAVDLNTKSVTTISDNLNIEQNWVRKSLLFINDELHIIRGKQNCKHWIFDVKQHKLQEIHNFDINNIIVFFRPFYLQQRKSIITSAYDRSNKSTSIMEYKDSKWNKLQIESNCEYVFASDITATINEDYLICGGGFDAKLKKKHNFIFIYDMRNKTLTKSEIELPSNNFPFLIITKDDNRDSLATFGFVNRCFRKEKYRDIQPLPFYLVKLIENWVSYETLHVIDNPKECHWTIDLDDIIISTFTQNS